jgi:hypothetical protein
MEEINKLDHNHVKGQKPKLKYSRELFPYPFCNKKIMFLFNTLYRMCPYM